MDIFAKRLKRLREDKKKHESKYTQGYVADLIGVARSTYTAYENGTKQPPMDTINRIADLFEVTSDYLLGRSNEPELTAEEDKRLTEETEYYLEILESLPDDERLIFEKKINDYADYLRSKQK